MIEFVDFSHVFERFSMEEKVEMYNAFAYTSNCPIFYRNTKENRERLIALYGRSGNLSCKWLVVKRETKICSISENDVNTGINLYIHKIYKCKEAWEEYFKVPFDELDYSPDRYFYKLFARLPFDVKVKIFNRNASSFHECMFLPDVEAGLAYLFYNDVHFYEYRTQRSYYFQNYKRWIRRFHIFKFDNRVVNKFRIYTKEEVSEIIWEHINDIYLEKSSWVKWMSYRPFITQIGDLPEPKYASINRYYIYDDVDKWWYRDEFENDDKIIL